MNSKSIRAFSFIEVVVVVAIIAILATILFILFSHARDDAAVASCESNERMIAEALDSYSLDHFGQYPAVVGDVNSGTFGGPGNPYFNRDDLTDPASGLPYEYTQGPGTCTNPDAEYQIIDQGGHSSASLLALLALDDQEDSVAFCAARGLYAMQSQGGAGGSMKKHH